MSYGTPLAITLPTINGVATEAEAATRINACFSTIKSRLEQKVSPASMDINADLSFLSGASYFGAKDLQRVAWTNLSAALAAGTFPYTAFTLNGNLYYNDGSGNQIQITAGGVVNIAGSGGITGAGYGAGTPLVEVNWDSVNNKYKFFGTGTSPNHYAALECDDVLLRDGSGNSVRFGTQAMGADYTMLLPSAVPGANSVVVMETGGNLSHTTAPAALTLAAGGHVTISGAGRFKHGTLVHLISPAAAIGVATVGTVAFSPTLGSWSFTNVAASVAYPLPFIVGHRLITVSLHCSFSTADTKTLRLRKIDSTGTVTTVQSLTTTSATGWASRVFNFNDTTFATGETYYLVFEPGHASDLVAGAEASYDLP